MKEKKIGLALGSGAVRGYALIPIIQMLEKNNIRISTVSGSSIGALIGAYYALYGEVDFIQETVAGMKKNDFLKLVDPNNPKISMIKGQKIKDFLQNKFFGDKTFDDCGIPLSICTTNFVKKKPVYLQEGKIIEAVMASVSIPGVFPLYEMDGNYYVDGGVMDPVPVKPLGEKGFKKSIAVNLMGYDLDHREPGKDMFSTLMTTFYLMMEQLARHETNENLYTIDLSFKPDPANMMAFYDWEKYFNAGKTEIEKQMDDILKWLG
jgi:NTE family protein